jgi:hypothetical protein
MLFNKNAPTQVLILLALSSYHSLALYLAFACNISNPSVLYILDNEAAEE